MQVDFIIVCKVAVEQAQSQLKVSETNILKLVLAAG